LKEVERLPSRTLFWVSQASVELGQAVEDLNLFGVTGLRHIDDDLDFLWVGKLSFVRDNVIENNPGSNEEVALLGIETDTILSTTQKALT